MRLASIDIGTNTILLLVIETNGNGRFKVLRDEQVIARLGKGVDENKIINTDTFNKAAEFLFDYKGICDSLSVDSIFAVGTSALRDAKNGKEFCSFIKDRTGIGIEILSGETEAIWTYRGGISEFSGRSESFSVIDIGGGSTELILGNEKEIFSKISMDIGSVRLTEKILKGSPPEESAIIEANRYILRHIPEDFSDLSKEYLSIGVAGTVTTLAALHQNLPRYIPEKVSGYILEIDTVRSMFDLLKQKDLEEIRMLPQISAGRADILLAGMMILIGVMERCKIPAITVSNRGLRYGIILRELESRNY